MPSIRRGKTNIKILWYQAVIYKTDDLQQVLHALNINFKMSTVKIKVKGFKGREIIINIISNLSNDRSKASSKMIPPHSAIQSFLLQLTVSSPALKVIQ